jgi:DNA-binding transcriptional ArsR family regulator
LPEIAMSALFKNRDLAISVAEKLKVYAQPQRLMILSCLLNGQRNVAEIGEATRIGQPALSQQLAELRRADLVSTRKEAKVVWYTLADDNIAQCVRTMEAIFGEGEMASPQSFSQSSKPNAPPRLSPDGVAAFARMIQ